MEKGWCDIDPNELVFTFGGSYVCANFGENRSRNATVKVPTDGHTDRLTDWSRDLILVLFTSLQWTHIRLTFN